MIEKNSLSDKIFMLIIYTLVTIIAITCLYPMLHVLFASVSDPVQLLSHSGVLLWPKGFSIEGYRVVLQNPNIGIGYRNTAFYVIIGTLINMLFTTMGAYALSRKGYMFKRFITFAIVFSMYFSGGLIPNYLLVRNLGMNNTRWALILPGAIATWNLIVMKTSFQHISPSLEESAKIDGANDFVVLFRIFIPVAKATLAVMILFYAVGHWNSWFNAMIYLRERSKFPLQLFLREILIANATAGNTSDDVDVYLLEEIIKYATIIISTVPILCIYPFVQKYFMSGVMLGSLKE